MPYVYKCLNALLFDQEIMRSSMCIALYEKALKLGIKALIVCPKRL